MDAQEGTYISRFKNKMIKVYYAWPAAFDGEAEVETDVDDFGG